MAKYGSRLGHKQFFTMSVLAVSVLGLIFVTGAVMKPTNTQSDASESKCNFIPQISNPSTEGSKNSVTYTLKILNESSAKCREGIYYLINDVNQPIGWKYDFTQYGKTIGVAYGYLLPQTQNKVKFKVTPPSNLVNGTYSIRVTVCRSIIDDNTPGDDNGGNPINLEDYWMGKTDQCSKVKLQYIKTNN